MGSSSDWPTMSKAVDVLTHFGVRPRGAGAVGASHARRDVRVRRIGTRSRVAGHHRRRRRSRPPAGHAGGQDHSCRCSACRPRLGISVVRIRCTRSCRCRPAFRSRRSRSARPGATNAALFAVALLAAGDADVGGRTRRLPPATPRRRRRGRASARTVNTHSDHAACHARHPRRRSARPLLRDRSAHDGLPHDRARTRSATRRPARSPTSISSPPTTTRPRLQHLASACAVVTTEFENPPSAAMELARAHTAGAPVAGAVAIAQDRQRRRRSCATAGIPVAPYRGDRDRRATSRAQRAPSTRRSSRPPAWATTARDRSPSPRTTIWPLRGRELGRQRCVLEQRLATRRRGVGRAGSRHRRRHRCLPDRAQHPRRRDPRLHRRAVRRAGRRRARHTDRRRRWTTSACSRWRCSSSTVSCWSTSSRRARTTAATGHSTRRAPASSSSRSARCAASVSATRRCRLLPRRWSTCSATCGPTASRTGRRSLADPNASLHLYGKTVGATGPQDGPHHRHRGDARGGRAQGEGNPIRTDDSVACADHDRRNLLRPHHGPHRLARSDLQPLVVPAR